MKGAFQLLAFMFLIAGCTSDDPNYTSLVGKWTFSSPKVKGSFEIADFSGSLAISDVNGSFSINGLTFQIAKKQPVVVNGFNVSFKLFGSIPTCGGCEPSIIFSGEYSSDYKTMTFKSYTYNTYSPPQVNNIQDDLVTMTRN